ncbi:uncharacterized protein LOC131931293, partial [Physella acuta]|uniref:uncharacterized protein LOC131931293 n=1 Tax=Physella acuta TaxID=109671 RepID=UPI0027DD2559
CKVQNVIVQNVIVQNVIVQNVIVQIVIVDNVKKQIRVCRTPVSPRSSNVKMPPIRQSYTKDMPPEALLHQSCEAILSPSQSHIIEILSSEEYPLGTHANRKTFKYSADVVIQDSRKGKKKVRSSRNPDDWDEDDVREFWKSRDKKVQSSDIDVNPALMLAREKFNRKKGKQRGSTLSIEGSDPREY